MAGQSENMGGEPQIKPASPAPTPKASPASLGQQGWGAAGERPPEGCRTSELRSFARQLSFPAELVGSQLWVLQVVPNTCSLLPLLEIAPRSLPGWRVFDH